MPTPSSSSSDRRPAAGGRYFIGVDAGGSRTRAVLTDASLEPLARAIGPGASATALGAEAAAARIAELCDRLLRDAEAAGSGPIQPALLAAGVAGAGPEVVRAELRSALARRACARTVRVASDVDAAFAAIGDGPSPPDAVVLIAGTGAIAYGKNARGGRARASGHGWLLGDEGSAVWIGRAALGAALKAADGRGAKTALAERILDLAGADPTARLRAHFYGISGGSTAQPAHYAEFFPVVAEVARAGDAVAAEILAAAAAELALAVRAVVAALDLGAAAFPVAFTGGVFHAGDVILRPLGAAVTEFAPRSRLAPLQHPPEIGVLRLALEGAGEARQ